MKKKGFTLIELLVVIAIIVILAVIALLAYNKFVKVAECSGHKEQHKKIWRIRMEKFKNPRTNHKIFIGNIPRHRKFQYL